MAFVDTAAANVASGITAIGLGTDSSTEVTGGGYTRLTPDYDGGTDLAAPLEFDGPANTTVTHLIFVNAGGTAFAELDEPLTFNSDGRLDIDSAEVTAQLLS